MNATHPRLLPAASALAALPLLLAAAPAHADGGLVWANITTGIGGAGFEGYPGTEYGFGLSFDSGAALELSDGFMVGAGLNSTWLRTSDPLGEGRVVTTGTFYGATISGGLGGREGGFFLRLGGGYAERDVDDLPDGEFNAVTRDSGAAALVGLAGVFGDGEGAGLTVGLDYVHQVSGEGMGFVYFFIGFGFLAGG